MSIKYERLNPKIFSNSDLELLINMIDLNPKNNGFGIRYFLRDNLNILGFIKSHKEFGELVRKYFSNPVIVKSIYFDKPPRSNWPVNWHQDITINLLKEVNDKRFKNSRSLSDRVVVQPNIGLLKSILTFRIHIDSADSNNGALSVIDDSEDEGIVRLNREYIESQGDKINLATISEGGVMIMSPLTIHSSKRSKDSNSRRRVIHLEVIEKSELSNLPFIELFEL